MIIVLLLMWVEVSDLLWIFMLSVMMEGLFILKFCFNVIVCVLVLGLLNFIMILVNLVVVDLVVGFFGMFVFGVNMCVW